MTRCRYLVQSLHCNCRLCVCVLFTASPSTTTSSLFKYYTRLSSASSSTTITTTTSSVVESVMGMIWSYSSGSLTSRSKANIKVVGYSFLPQLAELLRSSNNVLYLPSSSRRMKQIVLKYYFSFCASLSVAVLISLPILFSLAKIYSPPVIFRVSMEDLNLVRYALFDSVLNWRNNMKDMTAVCKDTRKFVFVSTPDTFLQY